MGQIIEMFGPPPKPQRRKGLTDPPDSVAITAEMRQWFKEQKLAGKPEDEMEAMLDFYRMTGRRMKDWVACWRNWCRKSRRMENQRFGVPKQEQDVRLTRTYIEAHARPGESYEEAERRLRREK